MICAAGLRKYTPEIASLLLVSSVVFLALLLMPLAQSVITQMIGLSDAALIEDGYLQALIKAVGICYITQLTADICRENGAQSTATQVELCGKTAILLTACPLYSDLLSLVSKFLEIGQ